MKKHEISPLNYIKAIELGYYELVKCISVYEKIVIHYKVCGRKEKLHIFLTK